jgi:hypothetical protein
MGAEASGSGRGSGRLTAQRVDRLPAPPPPKRAQDQALPEMVMIRDRPAEVIGRLVPGHREGGRSAIATLVERTTRFIIPVHLAGNRGAENLRDRLAESMTPLPAPSGRSLTWDQGTEMVCHQSLTRRTLIPVYFCDPACPWQRGANENTAPPVLPERNRPGRPRCESKPRPCFPLRVRGPCVCAAECRLSDERMTCLWLSSSPAASQSGLVQQGAPELFVHGTR